MSQGRKPIQNGYGWVEAEHDLADGIHPDVVAARLGVHTDTVLEVASDHGWPVRWSHDLPSPGRTLTMCAALFEFDA